MVGKCAEAECNVVVNRALKGSALARLDGVSLWAFCRQSPQVASVSVVFAEFIPYITLVVDSFSLAEVHGGGRRNHRRRHRSSGDSFPPVRAGASA
mmetsp:Transcript_2302/g.3483  ORF Transcript_2302/g.3483 Transcript_2302/m.3483 type:complete len:96 (-) Transcript_2302:732-1019(-)